MDGDGRQFALHGYTDADIANVDDAARHRREEAEAATSAAMAALIESLDDAQQQALIVRALATRGALKQPVAVSE